jgi:hypothetical protein
VNRTALSGIDPPDELSRRVRAALNAQRAPALRSNVRTAVAMIIAALMAVAVVVTASEIVYGKQAMGLLAGWQSPSVMVFIATALLTLMAVSTFMALWRGRSGLGASTALLMATGLVTAPLYALLTLNMPAHEMVDTVGSVRISIYGVRCLVLASVVGAIVLGCLASAMRATAPAGTRVRSLALGSAAGTWAGLAVFVFCPSGEPLHLLVGHVLPVAALAAIGAVVLPALLRP